MANNTYLWQEFNIKTFPSETIVFMDGVFKPELSTLESTNIDKKYDLPVHIIFIGEIAGECRLNIDISAAGQKVFLTTKIKNKKPAFLNIFVENTGKFSEFHGNVLAENYSELEINEKCRHLSANTTILLKNRIVAYDGSVNRLFGDALISTNAENCNSEIGFYALAAPTAKIQFRPAQYIKSIPTTASHSASIYRGSDHQIEYLHESGLTADQVKSVLAEAFKNWD
jgi:hypothetical protein